jgi:hypothetical protein
VSNEGKDIPVAKIAGAGSLGGTGKWIVGTNNDDFTLGTEVNSPMVKRGTGTMKMITLGKLNGTLTIEGGTVTFNNAELSTLVHGAYLTTVKNGGRVVGQGLLNALLVESGGRLVACGSAFNETTPGTIKVNNTMTVREGAYLTFNFSNAKQSQIQTKNLTMNGFVEVVLSDDFEPKDGAEYVLWDVTGTFSGTPGWSLPALPDGLYWDVDGLAQQRGVLRITANGSGIGSIAASTPVQCAVYTLSGNCIATFTANKGAAVQEARSRVSRAGTFIIKLSDGRRTETQKLIMK